MAEDEEQKIIVTGTMAQAGSQVMLASLFFCIGCIVYAWLWPKHFLRSPFGTLMRRFTGELQSLQPRTLDL